jgi:hypothetical protein
MFVHIARTACAAFVLIAGAARADDLADFNAAVEAAAAHNRVAIGYLHNGNVDLAALEVDRLRAAWRDLSNRFAAKRPAVFSGNDYYVVAMTDISTRLVTADMMLTSGRPEIVREALLAIRDDLYKLRKSAGIAVLADCIFDANKAAATLMENDTPELDLSKAGIGPAITEQAAAYAHILTRCNAMAGEALRNDGEFRRLIDEAESELAKVPRAVEARDASQIHRIVGSLRAIDTLLAFRFG